MTPNRRSLRRGPDERGGALLELAISIPIFIVLLALVFDAGLGFSAARESSAAARSAARVGALAGDNRLADYRALDAIRAEFNGTDDRVVWVSIYRSSPNGSGEVPAACLPGSSGHAGLCNVYDGSMLQSLDPINFQDPGCVGDPDAKWCPTDRALNDGDYLGVGIWTTHDATVGLIGPADYELDDRAVFALYFPDLAVAP